MGVDFWSRLVDADDKHAPEVEAVLCADCAYRKGYRKRPELPATPAAEPMAVAPPAAAPAPKADDVPF